jgi:hypothetical protein
VSPDNPSSEDSAYHVGPENRVSPDPNAPEPVVERSSSGVLHVRLSMEDLPKSLVTTIEKLSSPAPTSTRVVKDYLPALTPLAAVMVSIAVAYYTSAYNERASASAASETLSKLITEFDQSSGGTKKTWKNDQEREIEEQRAKRRKERGDRIKAMALAVYGDQALPAIKITLGAADDSVRRGSVLVAVQMYRAETVERAKLTREMLRYFDNAVLRRGVVEWLLEMDRQLPEEDSRLFLQKLTQSFGPEAQDCPKQDENVARDAADVLGIWHFPDSRDLLFGLAKQCESFEDAREEAIKALPKIAKVLPKPERGSLISEMEGLAPTTSPALKQRIASAIIEIQEIQDPH